MKFKELLKKADMSGAQLARRLGISVAAVSAWCKGKSSPGYEKLPEISKALNVNITDVIACFTEKQ